MLPFPIVSNTNIAPPKPKIKSATGGSGFQTFMVVLYDNGNLYGIGYNTNSQYGGPSTGTNILDRYTLLRSDVDRVFTGYDFTLVLTKDGKYFHTGNKNAVYGVTGTNTNFVDCSTLFSLVPTSSVQDIQIGFESILVLSTSGVLYSKGINSRGDCGSGNTSAQTVLTQRATGVKSCSLTSQTSYYILQDGSLFFTGIGGSQAGSSNYSNRGDGSIVSVSVFTKLTQLCNTVNSQVDTIFINTNSNVLMVTGFNSFNMSGTGNQQLRFINVPVSSSSLTGTYIQESSGFGWGKLIHTSTGLWSCGYRNQSGLGVNSDIATFTLLQANTPIQDYSTVQKIYSIGSGVGTVFIADNKLFGTGFSGFFGRQTPDLKFSTLPLPI